MDREPNIASASEYSKRFAVYPGCYCCCCPHMYLAQRAQRVVVHPGRVVHPFGHRDHQAILDAVDLEGLQGATSDGWVPGMAAKGE